MQKGATPVIMAENSFTKKETYQLQLDLVRLPGNRRSLPASHCYIFVKGLEESKQVENIFYSCMQIHLEGLLSIFKILFLPPFADNFSCLVMALKILSYGDAITSP